MIHPEAKRSDALCRRMNSSDFAQNYSFNPMSKSEWRVCHDTLAVCVDITGRDGSYFFSKLGGFFFLGVFHPIMHPCSWGQAPLTDSVCAHVEPRGEMRSQGSFLKVTFLAEV